MRNTTGLTRSQRKQARAARKAGWKTSMLNYYIVGETNTSAGGIVYQRLKISGAVKPKSHEQAHGVADWFYGYVSKLLKFKDAG